VRFFQYRNTLPGEAMAIPLRDVCASILLVATLTAGALEPPVSRAQPRVLVRAESRIELRTRRAVDVLVVEGALRDDLGQPLSDREITLRWRAIATPGPPVPQWGDRQRTLRTDRDGAFAVELPIASGAHHLSAWFAGDRMHERVEVARRIDLDRADVRLRVEVPNRGHLDLDVAVHEIVVRSQSDVGGDNVAIRILDELDRPLAAGTTDASGRATFHLRASDLGAPGAGRLKVRSTEDALRAEAQTEVPVIRFRRTTVTLTAEPSRAEAPASVRFEGALRDSRGPIEGRAVGLFARGDHLATTLTDGDGAFARTVELFEEGDVEVVARFESDAPGRTSSESAPVSIRVQGPGALSPWVWLLVPVCICLALLVWIARRTPPPPERATAAPPAPAGLSAGARVHRRPDRTDVAGRVVSHDAGEAISTARATLRATRGDLVCAVDDEGRFEFRDNPAGTYRLVVEAPGYLAADGLVVVPHRGEWTGSTVRLESMRARALAPFRRVAIPFLRSARAWPIRTNREVLEAARRVGPVPDALPPLTAEVERACYGPEPPDDSEVDRIDRLADRVVPPPPRPD
jgi:hypothetical protein